MKIKEAIDIFYRLYNEHNGSTDVAGLEDFEISRFINTAQYLELYGHTYNHYAKSSTLGSPLFALEDTTHSIEHWHSLVKAVPVSATNGKVMYADIINQMPDETIRMWDSDLPVPLEITVETRKIPIYKILNVAVGSDIESAVMCRFVRHNDLYAHQQNAFKAPTVAKPTETRYDDHLLILPALDTPVQVTVLRYPRHVWYSVSDPATNIDPELPDMTMNLILLRAVQLACGAVGRNDLYAAAQNERHGS